MRRGAVDRTEVLTAEWRQDGFGGGYEPFESAKDVLDNATRNGGYGEMYLGALALADTECPEFPADLRRALLARPKPEVSL